MSCPSLCLHIQLSKFLRCRCCAHHRSKSPTALHAMLGDALLFFGNTIAWDPNRPQPLHMACLSPPHTTTTATIHTYALALHHTPVLPPALATHPFEMAHELVLPLWSQVTNCTARCLAPTASTLELFIVLHGMLFTNIQLDGFSTTLVRLLEHLDIEEP